MKNKPVWLRIGLNVFFYLLALFGTYCTVLWQSDLFLYYVFMIPVPFITFAYSYLLAFLASNWSSIKIHFYFRPLLIASLPLTAIMLILAMRSSPSNPLPLMSYFSNVNNQQSLLHRAQSGAETVFVGNKNLPNNYKSYLPNGYEVAGIHYFEEESTLFWVHLLRPDFFRGADDYFAIFDGKEKRTYGLVSADEIWGRIESRTHNKYQRYPLDFTVSLNNYDKGKIDYFVKTPSRGDVEVSLVTDGKTMQIGDITFIPEK